MRLTEDEYAALLRRGQVREVGRMPDAFATLPAMTEKQLQNQVREVAKRLNALHYHTYRSTQSEPGFPDSLLVHGDTLWCLELKREGEAPTLAQQRWLDALAQVARVESGIVTPSTLAAWVRRIQAE